MYNCFMANSYFSFLKELDFMSTGIDLYIGGRRRIQNSVGGIFCILFVTIGLAGFFYFLAQILERVNPSVMMNRIYSYESSYFLNTSETVFAFKIEDKYGLDFAENTYSAVAQHWQYMFTEDKNGENVISYNFTNINISKCGQNFKLNSTEFQTLYKKTDLSNYYCLDPGQVFEIRYPFGSISNFSYINFYFTYCNHRADCKNASAIEEDLVTYYVQFLSTNYFVNNDNYTDPLQAYASSYTELSSSNYFKRIYYDLININHYTDDNLFFSSQTGIIKTSSYTKKSFIDYRNSTLDNAKVFLQFTYSFNPDGFVNVYYRNYKKVQNVLAEVGGFLNVVKIIFNLILFGYIEIIKIPLMFKDFYFYLGEKHKNFDNYKDKINNINIYVKTSNKNLNNLSIVPLSHQNDKKIKRGFNNTQHNIQKLDEKLNLVKLPRPAKIIKYFLCLRSNYNFQMPNQLAYIKLKNQFIYQYLDISSVIKSRNEINILKSLIINEGNENFYRILNRIIPLTETSENGEFNKNLFEIRNDNLNIDILRKYLQNEKIEIYD